MDHEPSESESRLRELAHKAARSLLTVRALRPFQVIPDQVTVDEVKVTIERRGLFRTEDIQTVLLSDISSVEVNYAFFLASVAIIARQTHVVPYLRKEDAVRMKQVITGLLVAQREGVKLGEVPHEGLTDTLAEIGRPH